jgi:3-oxoacyl-[acyl-carrier protein] reductase
LNLLDDKDFNKFLNKIKNINFDIIINNIGGGLGVRNVLSDYNDWYNVWKFNVGIAIKINNYFIKKMKRKKSGKLIHISSMAGFNGGPPVYPYGGSPSYACSKAYLNMYIKTLGRELDKFNITVSGIAPGPILIKNKHWDKLKKSNKKLFNKFIKEYVPTDKMLTINQVIPVIKLLCDDKKSPFNSSVIKINGKNN